MGVAMEITVTFTVKADVDGWARTRRITTDEAEREIFEYLAGIPENPISGQTYLTLDSTAVIES